jgi:metal-sulfur cluster biosynthetic enzyme
MTANAPDPDDIDPVEDVPSPDSDLCAYTEYREGPPIEELPATGEDSEGLAGDVWDALYDIEDPEMPVSIVDLGLIYGVDVEGGIANVQMTLTYSGCPARDMLLDEVREEAAAVEGIDNAEVSLVWSPEWSLELVTDQGKSDLKEFGLSV